MAGGIYNFCCIALFMVISVVLANRVRLANKCVTTVSEHANKLPVIMLHGLSSAKETWDGIYQSVSCLTDRRVCIYDARNHGESDWNDAFNIDVLVEDLANFMEDKKIKKASLVGHSLGGLTVIKFSLNHPEKVESIFAEDITPKNVSEENGERFKNLFRNLLDCLSAIPTDADEKTAMAAVKDHYTKLTGTPIPGIVFKTFPLRRKDGVWQWKANYETFIKAFEDAGHFLGKLEGRYDGRAFFIYGTASPVKVNEHKKDIQKLCPNAEFYGVEGADHSVHNNASIYISKLVHFLNQVSQSSAQIPH